MNTKDEMFERMGVMVRQLISKYDVSEKDITDYVRRTYLRHSPRQTLLPVREGSEEFKVECINGQVEGNS
jgi:hypothetical protein